MDKCATNDLRSFGKKDSQYLHDSLGVLLGWLAGCRVRAAWAPPRL